MNTFEQVSAATESMHEVAGIFKRALARLIDDRPPRGPGINLRGDWDPSATYSEGDIVTYNGESYVCQIAGTELRPRRNSTAWRINAARAARAEAKGEPFLLDTLLVLPDAATILWDLTRPMAQVTLGGNRTVQLMAGRPGATYVLLVRQDSVGGRTLTWPAEVRWTGNTAPTLSTGARRSDLIHLLFDGDVYYANLGQNYLPA